ncbi:hypothetical protein KKE68_04440 [Patescibacteria group bacterium]|nr:hypothetical protein [Patescibacteria group bacterium]
MKLQTIRKKHAGRDAHGRVAVRHQGGEHKRYIRNIDFKRDKFNIVGRVLEIQYDPGRTCNLALVQYTDGDKRYILAPEGLKLQDTVVAGKEIDAKIGNSMPLPRVSSTL